MPRTAPFVLTLLCALCASNASAQDADDATPRKGRALLQQGDFAGATEVFRALVARDDGDATSWFHLGRALHAQGKLDDALVAHLRAASFPLTARGGALNAARVYSRKEDLEPAFEWLGKARAAGFADRGPLLSNADFAHLRGDARFAEFLPPLLSGSAAFVEEPRVIHTFVGEAGGDQFGWVARPLGDLDGDGAVDFGATSPTWGAGRACGRAYIYSSRSGKELFRVEGEPGWQLGNSIAGGADVNGDGTPDVVIGAPGSGSGPGRAFVHSGKDGERLHELGLGQAGDRFGMKVSLIEDLDGDGHAEVAVGASGAGRVDVFSGHSGQRLFDIAGEAPGDGFGTSVDATQAGGHGLLIVGAPSAGPRGVGRAYVYRCSATGAEPAFTIDTDETGSNLGQYFVTVLGDVNADGTPDVYASDWNNAAKGPGTGRIFVHCGATGARLLTITGHRPGEGFGTSASVCGDVNGDGHADLAIGAWQNADVVGSAGKCYLHSGKDGALLRTWTSKQGGDTLGFDSVGLGDVDGDGHHDFLFTSAWSSVDHARQGRVFLVAGAPYE